MMVWVNTHEYEMSHGKLPRGRGYWAFRFDSDPEPVWSLPDRPYGEAVKDARKLAVARGAEKVTVCP